MLLIAVSGTSGAGKTTLVRGLARELATATGKSVVPMFFDDYAAVSQLPENDLPGWLERGADPSEWRTDRLVADLKALIAGEVISLPAGDRVGPADIVVLEEPFGRARPPMRPLIDTALHIALPLHFALARRLLRDFIPVTGPLDEAGTNSLRNYVDMYRGVSGTLYALIDDLAMKSSDHVLDGTLHGESLLELALAEVQRTRQRA